MNLTFESERLLFRPMRVDDLDLAVEEWTDPRVVQYVADRTFSVDELREEIQVVTRRCGGGCIGIWVLSDKETKEKLGEVFLLPMPVEVDDTDWTLVQGDQIPDGDIEVGYILKHSAWGQGFATEACSRILKFAFEETSLTEIVAVIDPENTASQRVLEKCGFQHQGMMRAYATDCPGFRITRPDWIAMHRA